MGTAASAVDLNPTDLGGITDSEAWSTNGNQEAGWGLGPGTGNIKHAVLWTGSAASAVDLNPTNLGISFSFALFTNGIMQTGYGIGAGTGGGGDAIVWSGTSASAVDLELFLPATDTWSGSEGFSVDSAGDVYGNAADVNGKGFAVEWSPVPEPASGSIMLIGSTGILMRRRRRNLNNPN